MNFFGMDVKVTSLTLLKGFDIWVFPKNRGTPKWMVKIMENPIKRDDFGVPLFSEASICRIG